MQITFNFFEAVQIRWPVSWNDRETKGNVLPTTNGFKALMRFLKPVYFELVKESNIGRVPSIDEFFSILNGVELEDNQFNTFKPGVLG